MEKIFVFGLIGAGKDTSKDYLQEVWEYHPIRLAHLIKSIICEKEGITFDELELRKRNEPRLRDMHHEVSEYLGGEKTDKIKIDQIIDGTNMLFDLMPNKNQHINICDVRSYRQAHQFLSGGFKGIFLTRTTSEYSNSEHWTNQNIYTNGDFDKLNNEFAENIFIIDNADQKSIFNNENYFTTDCSANELKNTLNIIMNKINF